MTPISVVILTKNEEAFIERCIRSVTWADEVLVVDSGSTDRTRELAQSLGARVYDQPWLGWPGQRNKGTSIAKNDWVLFVEADEIVTPELAVSIQQAFSGSINPKDGYSLDRRGDFLGLLLPNESRASKRLNFVRLFNREYSAYDSEMLTHEEVRFPGQAIPLKGVLLHWRGYQMNDYFGVFNRYATLEAQMLDAKGRRASGLSILIMPILRFGWSYVVKGGWRLGTRGLIHSMLKGASEYMRYAKLWEMQNVSPALDPPATIYPGQTQQVSSKPRPDAKS